MIGALCCGILGCNQLAGIDDPRDRVPAVLAAWAPRSSDPKARVTLVKTFKDRVYVGLSNGEIFLRSGGGTSRWTPLILAPTCGQVVPAAAVTALAITEKTTYVGFAGLETTVRAWAGPVDGGCWVPFGLDSDSWGLSASPFLGLDALWAHSAGSMLVTGATTRPSAVGDGDFVDFSGVLSAFAEGVSSTGARRVWLGSEAGGLYFSDEPDRARESGPIFWRPVEESRFPARGVLDITVNPDDPEKVWVTFRGAAVDSIWSSLDNGLTWRNAHGGALPGAPDAPPAAGVRDTHARIATFTAVSPVPGLDFVYLTALLPDPNGVAVAWPFWSTGDGGMWRQQ
jgi:hypothetical protein